ncbi:FecR family protein [Paenibacillus filicis]|uniref:FecR family protein n=1 Tax=Paenibacillus gyeongsangnamensis TaxID=3388067 RepID=A0ABT4Q5F7_9BACL|nr:FecR family protein [Paenibacillus filicis]MCZ8512103.1 FecR family protein [Paenibacillus filicis]
MLNIIGRSKGRPLGIMVLLFTLLFSLLSVPVAPKAQAKTVRAAIVSDVTGDVKVKKAGGSKSYQVYKDMTLNQGDLITTGKASYAVLKIVDHDDELTISDNAEVYISDLMDHGAGKTSKLKSWAGSMWSKVKSLVSSDDEFEVETPTAVMGVRGTQFLTYINPKTGQTLMLVVAGKVSAANLLSSGSGSGSVQSQNRVTVYPAQQILLTTSTKDPEPDLRSKISYTDAKQIVDLVSPKVLEAFIKNIPGIQAENDQIKQQLLEQFNQGITKPDASSVLLLETQAELDAVRNNFDAIIPLLAKQAVDSKKIDSALIDSVNRQIFDPSKRIDFMKEPVPLDKNAGMDPKLFVPPAPENPFDRERKEMQAAQRSADLQKMEQQMAGIIEANKKTEAALNQAAVDSFMATLDSAGRQAFIDNQKKNAQATTPSTAGSSGGNGVSAGGSGGTGGNTGSSSSDDSRIEAPTVTAPAAVVKNPVVLKAKASAKATIQIYNGATLVGSQAGNDAADVEIQLSPLAEGAANLTAKAVRGSRSSSAVAIPAFTVVDPGTAVLVSPTADTVFGKGMAKIEAKAPAGSKILVLNTDQVLAGADGKGADTVTIPLPDGNYSGLKLVTEKSGIRGNAVPVPGRISVDTSSTAGFVLSDPVISNGVATYTLKLKNFTGSSAFYAVEAHLVYNNSELNYEGPTELPSNASTVFGSGDSAEILNQIQGQTQNELIYAGTRFVQGNTAAENLTVDGEKVLVTIPLKIRNAAATPAASLVYMKIVNKDSGTVYEWPIQSGSVTNTVAP